MNTGGPIGYMVRNGVAANLLMLLMLVAGLLSAGRLVQEGTWVLAFEAVEVLVAYPGATPEEVEESIVLRIEEQVAALDGVNEVTAVAAEGLASVIVGLQTGVDVDRDADLYEERRNLLLGNGALGLLLVLVALALFLDLRVAAWVVVGMATSFVGALAAALLLGVPINMYTLFGFVVAVGLVVDDAIVVAEHVHAERLRGRPAEEAAILGTRRIARPLIFAVLTTVAAFLPLMLLPGPLGELGRDIAFVPVAVLSLSLIESLLILPRHLAHLPHPDQRAGSRVARFFSAVSSRADRRLHRFVEGPLDGALRAATRHPAPIVPEGA